MAAVLQQRQAQGGRGSSRRAPAAPRSFGRPGPGAAQTPLVARAPRPLHGKNMSMHARSASVCFSVGALRPEPAAWVLTKPAGLQAKRTGGGGGRGGGLGPLAQRLVLALQRAVDGRQRGQLALIRLDPAQWRKVEGGRRSGGRQAAAVAGGGHARRRCGAISGVESCLRCITGLVGAAERAGRHCRGKTLRTWRPAASLRAPAPP